MTELVCSFCRAKQRHELGPKAGAAAERTALLAVRCKRCFRVGSVQVTKQLELELPPPQRGSVHGQPDDIADEELARSRSRMRSVPP